jgi:hypothetical protein
VIMADTNPEEIRRRFQREPTRAELWTALTLDDRIRYFQGILDALYSGVITVERIPENGMVEDVMIVDRSPHGTN